MLRLKLPFSEDAHSLLIDSVSDPASDTPDEGRWLFIHVIKPDLAQYAHEINMLLAGGKLDLPNGTQLLPGHLKNVTLESYDEGSVEILIGDETRRRIERTAAYVLALNEKMGVKLMWKEAREWVYLRCLSKVSETGAKSDARLIDEEERSLYPPAHTDDGPTPPTPPPGFPNRVPLLTGVQRGDRRARAGREHPA